MVHICRHYSQDGCKGFYLERSEVEPSNNASKKIAYVLEVSLDNIGGEGILESFDKKPIQRFKNLDRLEDDKKKTLYDLIYTYIGDAIARRAYA